MYYTYIFIPTPATLFYIKTSACLVVYVIVTVVEHKSDLEEIYFHNH